MIFSAKLVCIFQLTNMLKLQINGGMKNIFDMFQKDPMLAIFVIRWYIYGPSMPRMVKISFFLYFSIKDGTFAKILMNEIIMMDL